MAIAVFSQRRSCRSVTLRDWLHSGSPTHSYNQAKLRRARGQTSDAEEPDSGKAHSSCESCQRLENHLLLTAVMVLQFLDHHHMVMRSGDKLIHGMIRTNVL